MDGENIVSISPEMAAVERARVMDERDRKKFYEIVERIHRARKVFLTVEMQYEVASQKLWGAKHDMALHLGLMEYQIDAFWDLFNTKKMGGELAEIRQAAMTAHEALFDKLKLVR